MPSIEELNNEKESLLKQRNLRDERFEEQLQQAIAENKDRYNPNTGTINALSDREIQEMRDKHNEDMEKEFGSKINDIDNKVKEITTIEDNLKKSNAEMEEIKRQIEEKNKEMERVETEAKQFEAEYNQAYVNAFHGENATGVIDSNLTAKKDEIEGKVKDIATQRESLINKLSQYEIDNKELQRELDKHLNDIPEIDDKTPASNPVEQKEENTSNDPERDETDEDAVDNLLDEENEVDSEVINEVDLDNPDQEPYQMNEQEQASYDKMINDWENGVDVKDEESKEYGSIEDGTYDFNMRVADGKMYIACYHGVKDFKILLSDRDGETSVEEVLKNFTEGEDAILTPRELSKLLADWDKIDQANATNKDEVFDQATNLTEFDKTAIANLISYHKAVMAEVKEKGGDVEKVRDNMKYAVGRYMDKIDGRDESGIPIKIDLKNKKSWGTNNKDFTNYEMIKDWAYAHKKNPSISIDTSFGLDVKWAFKDLRRRFRGYDEALPPVKEEVPSEQINEYAEKTDEDAKEIAVEMEQETEREDSATEAVQQDVEAEKDEYTEVLEAVENEDKQEVSEEPKKDEAYYDELLDKAVEELKRKEQQKEDNDDMDM